MAVEFPTYYFEGNLVFNKDGSCWAYYEIPGYKYEFLSDGEKASQFQTLKSFFWQINNETHLLVVPSFQSIEEIHENYKSRLSGPLQHVAAGHADDTKKQLMHMFGEEGTQYKFFIGVKLQNLKKQKISILNEFKAAWKEFISSLYDASGIDVPDILEEDIKRYEKQAWQMKNIISEKLGGYPVDEAVIQWLLRRNFYRGIGKEPILQNWRPAYSVSYKEYDSGHVTVRRPMYHDILRLSEGLIDDSTGRSIQMKQMIGGVEKVGHTAFITLSEMPYEMNSRGDEWVYNMLQTIDFPAEVSIRTNYIENRKALSIVRNKQKELKDQDRHAMETNHDTSLRVLDARNEAMEMEANLESSRMPLIKTSVVIAVSAPNDEELLRRTNVIRNHYQNALIQTEQPYGDQLKLFNEFLPGADRFVKDYVHYMEPGMLGASMFGATNQIGDGEGSFIGTTAILNQPVYIQPSLAAQGRHKTKTNALSAAFLGSLGGGKSLTANLITYLSVLAGGKALVIDPKGERGNWAEDLSELDGHKNIITLRRDEENKGKLDPFSLYSDPKKAETLALNILAFLTGVQLNDASKFPKLSNAVQKVSISENPCMKNVVDTLLESDDPAAWDLGSHIQSFMNLSFAQLLFGDGRQSDPIRLDTALNVLQIHELEMPDPTTPEERYTLSQRLSVAMMFSISDFAKQFVRSDRSQFKVVLFDEAWSVLSTSQGSELAKKLVREGREKKAAIYLITQNASDLLDETVKNNIGMKFAFRSSDPKEIKNVLELFNLSDIKKNRDEIRNLSNGQCLMQDIHHRVGVVDINVLFKDIFDAFDTRPPEEVAATQE